jgi:hypothetical protein
MIRPGIVLVEKSAALPEVLRLGNDIDGTGWSPVAGDLDHRQMESKLSATGWTFFFMAHSIKIVAFGFDRPKAILKALRRLVTAVKREQCNALEIDGLETRSFWGLPYVSLSAHPRHIQQGMVFGSKI